MSHALLGGIGSQDYIWASDAHVGSLIGDFEIICLVASDNYSVDNDLINQWHNSDLGVNSYIGSSRINLRVSTNGTAIAASYFCPSLTWTNGQHYWVRITYDIDNGSGSSVATFYRSTDPIDTDPTAVTWTNVGSRTATALTSLHQPSGNWNLGAAENAASGFTDRILNGKFYTAVAWADLTRTTRVLNPDFRDDSQADWSTGSGDDDEANTWTFENGAVWVDDGPAFESASLLATATQTIVDVVNENDDTTDLHLSVDDDPATPNDDDWVNNAVVITAGASVFFDVTDLDPDFGNAESGTVVVRTGAVDVGATTLRLYARLYQSDETTPLSDEVEVAAHASDSSFANSSPITFTGLNTTVGKAVWDGARVRFRWGT